MSDKYILKGKEAVPAKDLMEWAQWFEKADRHVAVEHIGDIRISTVFLGIDHSFDDGPPMLFETMIFGGEHDEWQDRCSTWAEAEAMHKQAVELVRSSLH